MKRKVRLATLGFVLLILLVFTPQLLLIVHSGDRIYNQPQDVPVREYGVVLGAYVFEGQVLSDAARERVEAAIELYRQGRVQRLFISGDNRSNQQADAMALYAWNNDVAAEDVVVDRLGIDTHDTCRHFAEIASEGVLITQGYHLPRAMYMCEGDGVKVVGLAANRLDILAVRGNSPFEVYTTRVGRFVRESLLTWSFVLGIYDRVSDDAEVIETSSGLLPVSSQPTLVAQHTSIYRRLR